MTSEEGTDNVDTEAGLLCYVIELPENYELISVNYHDGAVQPSPPSGEESQPQDCGTEAALGSSAVESEGSGQQDAEEEVSLQAASQTESCPSTSVQEGMHFVRFEELASFPSSSLPASRVEELDSGIQTPFGDTNSEGLPAAKRARYVIPDFNNIPPLDRNSLMENRARAVARSLEEKFRCQHCGRNHSSVNRMRYHQVLEHKMKFYQCNKCDDLFPIKCNMTTHRQAFHRYHCPNCDRSFTIANKLAEHMDVIHDIHLCTTCFEQFSLKVLLDLHVGDGHRNLDRRPIIYYAPDA